MFSLNVSRATSSNRLRLAWRTTEIKTSYLSRSYLLAPHRPWHWQLQVHPIRRMNNTWFRAKFELTLVWTLSSFRVSATKPSIFAILSSIRIWWEYKVNIAMFQMVILQTSWTIFNNCEWLPSRALRNTGRFFTTLRRFNICRTRWEAGLALTVTRASDEASYDL